MVPHQTQTTKATVISPHKTTMSNNHHHWKPLSPTNVNTFPTKGWASKDQPITAIVPGCICDVIGYKDYSFLNKRVLCTQAFSTMTVATTVNDGTTPPGSTKLDDNTGAQLQDATTTLQGLLHSCPWHPTWLTLCPLKQATILEYAPTGH
jgi:hypothetical protein